MRNLLKNQSAGFTLIEILVVIGLIAILAVIVLVAINPARQFAQGRNTQRTSDVTAILNAVGQNIADNKGTFTCGSVTIPVTTTQVTHPMNSVPTSTTNPPDGAKKITSISGAGNIDLSCLVPTYISSLPFDPNNSTGAKWTDPSNYDTEYYIIQDNSTAGGNRITVFSNQLESALKQTTFTEITR